MSKLKVMKTDLVTDGLEVARLIREAILTGELIAGQRLVESDLAEMLTASRGSVRTALNALVAEDLVEKPRNHTARVRRLVLDEALEIIHLRALIEAECAAEAAIAASAESINYLRALGQRMRESVNKSDNDEYSNLNRALHAEIIHASGFRVSEQIIKRLRVQQARYSIQLSRQSGRPNESLPEHLKIVHMIAKRDRDQAREAMYQHLMSVKAATEKYFEKQPLV